MAFKYVSSFKCFEKESVSNKAKYIYLSYTLKTWLIH